ncbi:MAG: hypothetical protein R3F54_18095 [Alphaproteobacteria bacterium]
MSLDVSDAIALAKDLLKTSSEYRPHDPAMAAEFSSRAFEICDDLGIDRALIGDVAEPLVDQVTTTDDTDNGSVAMAALTPAKAGDDEARQTSQQLRDLLQQQARVLETMREAEAAPQPKERRRSFRLFGRPAGSGFGTLQSA